MLNIQKVLVFSFLITSLAACSAKLEGGGSQPAPEVGQTEMAGPNLDGVWQTACEPDDFSAGTKRITMVIKAKSIHRTQEKFSDTQCRYPAQRRGDDGVIRNDIWVGAGTLAFEAKYANDVYKVRYAFDLGNGVTSLTSENVRRQDKTLWISEFYNGETVQPQTALALIGEAK